MPILTVPVIVSVAAVAYYVGFTFPLTVAIFVAMFYRQVGLLHNPCIPADLDRLYGTESAAGRSDDSCRFCQDQSTRCMERPLPELPS